MRQKKRENILISFKREDDQVDVYIVNDLLKNLEETLVLQLRPREMYCGIPLQQ